MQKKKGFDLEGLFFVINAMNRSFSKPLPKGFERFGFCHFCLGANYPGHSFENQARWCCGAWVDALLPPMKVCEQFQADKERIADSIKSFLPTAKSAMRVKSDPIKEVSFTIGGIVIKMPITQ